jgi:hypothetical protein
VSKQSVSVTEIRSKLFGNVENILDTVSKIRTSQPDSDSLFGSAEDSKPQLQLTDQYPMFSELDVLLQEKNSLGLYVSGSPLAKYFPILTWVRDEVSRDDIHLVIVDKIRKIFTRAGTMMLALQITSADEVNYEGIVFPKNAPRLSPLLAEKQIFWVKGRILENKKKDTKVEEESGERSFEELPKIALEEVSPFSEGAVALFQNEEIKLPVTRQKTLTAVPWSALQTHPDKFEQFLSGDVVLPDGSPAGITEVKIPAHTSADLLKRIKAMLMTTHAPGTEQVELSIEKGGEWKKAKGTFFANVSKLIELLDSTKENTPEN